MIVLKVAAFVTVDIKDLGHGLGPLVVMLQMGRVQFAWDKVCVTGSSFRGFDPSYTKTTVYSFIQRV